MKGPLERPVGAEAEESLTEDLTLARVSRRGESRLLALAAMAAVVLVGISAVKPWGSATPSATSSGTNATGTPTVHVYVRAPATIPQPVVVAIGSDSTILYWSCVETLDDAGQTADPAAVATPQVLKLLSSPVPFVQSGGAIMIGSDCQAELERLGAMARFLQSSRPTQNSGETPP